MTPHPPPLRHVARADEPIVFVVDDDEGIREATRSLIASVGLRVETFKTAKEFLSRMRPEGPLLPGVLLTISRPAVPFVL